MCLRTLVGAVALAFTTTTAIAAPINLEFSFGQISVTLFGLDNADGTSIATGACVVACSWHSFDLTGFVDGENIASNSFTFRSGRLIDYSLAIYPNSVSDEYASWFLRRVFLFPTVHEVLHVLTPYDDYVYWEPSERFPVVITQSEIPSVPLPAGALLLLTGLFGLATAHRPRNRSE